VIVKHNNPCGVATGDDPLDAYRKAFACDPQSAFGGVIAFNRPVDGALAEALVQQFAEVLFAPGYDDAALATLSSRPNLRILQDDGQQALHLAEPDLKQVVGGLLVQDRDLDTQERSEMTVATRREPTDAEWSELLFAWRVCKHVRSNAIVLSSGGASVGIGAGQMSRVDSVRIALEKAREAQPDVLRGAALASDAFFPFPDGPQLAIEAGVTAIVQPGGSVRDAEVIAAADEHDMAMLFTGKRQFRH
jgi:phosphoribosylaminoimidazolecarboxamide formyltransferase/IMP cyclohydrolase